VKISSEVVAEEPVVEPPLEAIPGYVEAARAIFTGGELFQAE
jgi:hypothetical protein